MSDPAILLVNNDSAVLSGGAVTAVAQSNAGIATPESFGGVLNERMKTTDSHVLSPPHGPPPSGKMQVKTGEPLPASGDALPHLDVDPESSLAEESIKAQFNASALMLDGVSDELSADLPGEVSTVIGTHAVGDSPLSGSGVGEITPGILPIDVRLLKGLANAAAHTNTSQSSQASHSLSNPQVINGFLAPGARGANSEGLINSGVNLTTKNSDLVAAGHQQGQLIGSPLSAQARLALMRANKQEGSAVRSNGHEGLISQVAPKALVISKALGLEGRAVATEQALRSTTMASPFMTHSAVQPQLVNSQNKIQTGNTFDRVLTAMAPMVTTDGSELSQTGLLSNIQGQGTASITNSMPSLTVATSVGQPGWSSEVGQRISWMASNELREAKLQLNPRSLGPVEIRIVYGHEQQLNVSFVASNPVAREALEAALPRLREMFEQQGLNLADTDISHESFAEQQRRGRQTENDESQKHQGLHDDEDQLERELSQNPVIVNLAEGMLDAYA